MSGYQQHSYLTSIKEDTLSFQFLFQFWLKGYMFVTLNLYFYALGNLTSLCTVDICDLTR